DRHTVQDDLVPTAHRCARHRSLEPPDEIVPPLPDRVRVGGPVERDDELDEGRLRRGRAPGRGEPERHGERCRQEDEKTPAQAENRTGDRRYTVPPRGCGGIGRRARFRSVWAKARGGSSPLIRIRGAPPGGTSEPRSVRQRRQVVCGGELSIGQREQTVARLLLPISCSVVVVPPRAVSKHVLLVCRSIEPEGGGCVP